MRHVTLKNLLARKLRLLTTSIAIAFGVAFITGALILGATINRTFDDLFANAYKNTDSVVRGEKAFTFGNSDVRLPIDSSLLTAVKAVPGVADAELNYDAAVQLIGPDGATVNSDGAPTYADVWSKNEELNPFQIVEGTPPTAPTQVVIDKGTSKKSKIDVGDTVRLLTASAPTDFTVSGIAKFGQVDSPAGAAYVLLDQPEAERLLAQPGKVESIGVLADDSVSQGEITNSIAAALPKNLEVSTGAAVQAESQAELKRNIRFISLFLQIFGFITLFVGAFIINNTFSILLAQRTRETALMRAIGATRGQVLRSMIAEAFALGLVASVLGIALGIAISIGIKVLLRAFDIDIANGPIVVSPSAALTALVAGIGITLASAVLPARRSSKVAPMAALRDVAIDNTARSIKRFFAGLVVALVGGALIAVGLITDIPKPYVPVGIGAALVFVGVAIMGPAIARPASWLIGWPLPKLMGTTGHLARENALRNPRRTSATAAALMVGVAVVGLFSVLFTSVQVSTAKSIDKALRSDFIISPGGGGMTGFSPAMYDD